MGRAENANSPSWSPREKHHSRTTKKLAHTSFSMWVIIILTKKMWVIISFLFFPQTSAENQG
jgi:hypothetical protein